MTVRKGETAPNNEVKLLSVGRLDLEKGLTYLVKAVYKLINEVGLEVTLTVVGTGPEENRLKQEATRLGLDKSIQFLGYVPFGPGLLEIYAENDVFLLPSLTEGLPQVLLEAMACGVPVVATRVAGIPQLISDRENGLLVGPGDVNQLAKAVCQLVEDKVLRERIRENGFRTAKEHTIEAEVERIMSALRCSFPTLNL